METVYSLSFYLFAAISVTGAVMVVAFKNPVSSAISMITTLLAVAVLFAFLSAHLLAIFQILVYAGAIMVLVLFVIMTLNLTKADLTRQRLVTVYKVVGCCGVGLVLMLVLPRLFLQKEFGTVPKDFGTIEQVGEILYTRYALPIQIAALILLVAIIGAVVLTQKTKKEENQP